MARIILRDDGGEVVVGGEITLIGSSTAGEKVIVTGGTVTYCALDEGPLARYDGSDTHIELITFGDEPDESAFDPSPGS